MSINDHLGRLLFIVPYVANRDGVPLKELAEKIGVSPMQIEADLDLLSLVGRPPLTPDHLIDMYVEDEVVYVDLDQSLTRPLRLTHEEARALVLGARLVGRLGGLGDELDKVLNKILSSLNPVDREAVKALTNKIAVSSDEYGPSGPQTALLEAISKHQQVKIDYYSVSSDRQKIYILKPLALLAHSGEEYLLALDTEASDQEKLFRLDRMSILETMPEKFVPKEDLELERFRIRRLYSGSTAATAEVFFSSEVAKEVSERFADSSVKKDAAGNIRVQLSTSSPAWLARWVLPFGTAAEVLGPSEAREMLGQLCARAAAAYEQAPEPSQPSPS